MPDERLTRILIVDDDPMICDLLVERFSAAGYDVDCRGDGGEVIAAIWAFDPDLLIIDSVLPHTPGAEVVRRLRAAEAGRRLPVVMMSGAQGSRPELTAMRAGADAFVRKPFALNELVEAVHGLLAATARPR